MGDVARRNLQHLPLEGRKLHLRARRISRGAKLLTTVIASARRIHRSGPGSRALPAESELANKSCRSRRARRTRRSARPAPIRTPRASQRACPRRPAPSSRSTVRRRKSPARVVETTLWRGVSSLHLHLPLFPTIDSTMIHHDHDHDLYLSTPSSLHLHLPLFPTMDSTTTTTYYYQVPARDAARARKGASD